MRGKEIDWHGKCPIVLRRESDEVREEESLLWRTEKHLQHPKGERDATRCVRRGQKKNTLYERKTGDERIAIRVRSIDRWGEAGVMRAAFHMMCEAFSNFSIAGAALLS